MKQQKLLFRPLDVVVAAASLQRSTTSTTNDDQSSSSSSDDDDEDMNISLSALASRTLKKRPLQNSLLNQNVSNGRNNVVSEKSQVKAGASASVKSEESSSTTIKSKRPRVPPPQSRQTSQLTTDERRSTEYRQQPALEQGFSVKSDLDNQQSSSPSRQQRIIQTTLKEPDPVTLAENNGPNEEAKSKEKDSSNNSKNNSSKTRRRVSSVSMDYVDPDLELKKPRINILERLHHREVHGNHIPRNATNKRKALVTPPFRQFKSPSYMELASIRSRPGTTDAGVLQLAWDPMGILLAAAGAKAIYIFDWDIVHAIDTKGQSERSRQRSYSQQHQDNKPYPRQRWDVPPILSFECSQYVSCIEWNTFDMDLLAVGFRGTGAVHIYHVDSVSSWLTKQSQSRCAPPPACTYQTLVHPRCNGAVSSILFVSSNIVVVSTGANTFCWKVPAIGSLQKPVLKWRYRSSENITSMEKLGSDTLILGSDKGRLIFISFQKSIKGALSSDPKPVILRELIPHTKLKEYPNDGSMGILKMSVDDSCSSAKVGVAKSKYTRATITWVTRGGWLLSTTLLLHQSEKIQAECQVHHEPPRVKVVNTEGETLQMASTTWSAPIEAMTTDSSPVFCFSDVPAVTRILPHHNKYVLMDSQATVTHSKTRRLLWKDFDYMDVDAAPSSIPLPKGCKRLPQTIAVHPSREWIVTGYADGKLVGFSPRG